ncbi:MAG: hypothetical protein Q9187_000437 [Circinaria calcarea]
MSAPPTYEAATSSGSSTQSNHLKPRNGIPPISRRSMEDEARPLPPGWIRQYDPKNSHQFFVDTTANPPRSIWQHPYDDQQFLDSLDPQERERILSLHKVPSKADVEAESSDDDTEGGHHSHPQQPPIGGMHRFGRKMKDKITGMTHEERELQRRRRAEEEQRAYARHQALRQAMSRAIETGQPQLVGRGEDGKEIYIEPPMYGGGMPPGAYRYNPYVQGPYTHTSGNAMYIRPAYPYSRPYGYGYGGGYGLPLAGGLLGGALLGGLLF